MTWPTLRAGQLNRFSRGPDPEQITLRNVTFELWPRTITMISGPPGEARTALIGCVTGQSDPDAGTVWLGDERISRRGRLTRHQAVGVLHRHGMLLTHLTLTENVSLVQRASGKPGLPPPCDILARVGLADRHADRPADLHPAETVLAGLAAALATGPSVLVADDPTAGLPADNPVPDLLAAVAASGVAILVFGNDPAMATHARHRYHLTDGHWAPA